MSSSSRGVLPTAQSGTSGPDWKRNPTVSAPEVGAAPVLGGVDGVVTCGSFGIKRLRCAQQVLDQGVYHMVRDELAPDRVHLIRAQVLAQQGLSIGCSLQLDEVTPYLVPRLADQIPELGNLRLAERMGILGRRLGLAKKELEHLE